MSVYKSLSMKILKRGMGCFSQEKVGTDAEARDGLFIISVCFNTHWTERSLLAMGHSLIIKLGVLRKKER